MKYRKEFDIEVEKPRTWAMVFRDNQQSKEVIHLLSKLLRYSPTRRISAMNALCHPYFDELRNGPVKLPSGREVPSELLTFLPFEIENMSTAQKAKLVRTE